MTYQHSDLIHILEIYFKYPNYNEVDIYNSIIVSEPNITYTKYIYIYIYIYILVRFL